MKADKTLALLLSRPDLNIVKDDLNIPVGQWEFEEEIEWIVDDDGIWIKVWHIGEELASLDCLDEDARWISNVEYRRDLVDFEEGDIVCMRKESLDDAKSGRFEIVGHGGMDGSVQLMLHESTEDSGFFGQHFKGKACYTFWMEVWCLSFCTGVSKIVPVDVEAKCLAKSLY